MPTDGYDALLWNDGDGTFTEGARAAGIDSLRLALRRGGRRRERRRAAGPLRRRLHGRERADPASSAGFPTNHLGVRDLLFLNEGNGANGHARSARSGGRPASTRRTYDHALGAVFTDVDGDGRLDLYVANDADPNQLYVNDARRRRPGSGSGSTSVARREGVADPNAGMGIAAGGLHRDGRPDLLVTNSRGQLHAAYRSRCRRRTSFADARPALAAAFGTHSTGWGASWVDLDNDGDLDLVLANGAIPVTNLAKNAERVQVLENRDVRRSARFVVAGDVVGTDAVPRVNGRGLAAADFDNDGDVDLAVNSIGGKLILLREPRARRPLARGAAAAFAPGAVVTAVLPDGRRLVREVHAGSSYLSSEDPRVHFGLGKATRVRELPVRYPDGRSTGCGTSPPTGSSRSPLKLAARPWIWTRAATIVSNVTAKSRIEPVTM